jgi:hypothetical protein
MPLSLEDARATLRTVIRSIDKKVEFSVALDDGTRPGVTVALARQKDKATIAISQEQLEAAIGDSMARSNLRGMLKRTIDRMSFRPNEVASTKMVRGTITDDGFFRPRQGGFRGGRR